MSLAIQRRRSPRNPVTALVHVRRPELMLASGESSLCEAANFSNNGIYLVGEKQTIRERVKLLLSFPQLPQAPEAERECLAEVVRVDALPRGRFGVAAMLLHHIQLRLRDGLIVPETGFWMNWPHGESQVISVYA